MGTMQQFAQWGRDPSTSLYDGLLAGGRLMVIALFGAMPVASAQDMARASDPPCYERNIQPLIEERCASCHYQGEHNMRTYETAKMHAYGIYREVMSGNKTMQGRLTSAEKKLFEAWHLAGEPRCPDPNRKK